MEEIQDIGNQIDYNNLTYHYNCFKKFYSF